MNDAEADEYVACTEAFLDSFIALLANAEPVNQTRAGSWWRSRRRSTTLTISTLQPGDA